MKKTYILTGGSSGIGYELSKKLSQDSNIVILSRQAENIDLINNSTVFGINTDVRSVEQLTNAYNKVTKELGIQIIHGLINCAGVAYEKKLSEITEEDYLRIFDTNVKGLIFTSKTFVDLVKEEEGIICNISSIAGIKGFSDWSLYAASKFAVEGFTHSIRHELRHKGIRVMCIRPGSVDTNIYKHLSRKEKKHFIKPETIATIVYNLLRLPKEAVAEETFINNSVGDL